MNLETRYLGLTLALAAFPRPDTYPLSPERYVEHVRRVKDAVRIPVIASLNGMTGESWAGFAKNIEQAGADALGLNINECPAGAPLPGDCLCV